MSKILPTLILVLFLHFSLIRLVRSEIGLKCIKLYFLFLYLLSSIIETWWKISSSFIFSFSAKLSKIGQTKENLFISCLPKLLENDESNWNCDIKNLKSRTHAVWSATLAVGSHPYAGHRRPIAAIHDHGASIGRSYLCVCLWFRAARKKKLLLVKGIVVEIKIKANYLFRPMAQTRFGIFLGIWYE